MVFGERWYCAINVGATTPNANRIMKEKNCVPNSKLHVMILFVRSLSFFIANLWSCSSEHSPPRRGGEAATLKQNIAKLPFMERTGWSDRRSVGMAPN